MLRRRLITIGLAIVVLAGSLLGLTAINAASGDWRLVWSDEFNGTAGSGVDTSKWVYETGGGGWGNGELENYTNRTDNVYLEQDPNNPDNRFLVIKALKEAYGGSQYTSGRIKTQGKFSFQYGKVEMRAKLPYGQGIWPAFWMLGDDITTVNWPNCGEVDIMEFVGSTPTKTYGTIHGPGYNGGGGLGAWHDYPAGFTNDFHTYAIEWEPNVFRWYFDGQMYQTRTVDDLAGRQWVFAHNFFILLNQAVGGAWPGNPDASTVFPQKYTVDYVRVYQREGGVYPTPTPRNLLTMKSQSSNQFTCADNYNNMLLAADRAAASTWETFEQKDLGNGNVAFIALMDYKYVSAGSGGNSQLVANKETVGPSETFQIVNNADGTKSLLCTANNKYVSVNSSKALYASATSIGNAEKFTFAYSGNPPPAQVATPSITPGGGNYTGPQTVSISCATSGATIKYTLDGSTPNTGSTTYTAPISISANTTLKAYAYKSGMTDSAVATAVYTFGGGGTLPSATWYLFNTAVSGVTPAGQDLQTANSTVTGWQPTRAVSTTPAYWYGTALNGSYNAGNWSFVLWTNSPASASTIQVSLYKVNSDGSGAVQIGTAQSLDVKTTGGGNHPSTFNFTGVPSVSFSNQLLMVKVEKTAGVDATMAYNTNDFPSRLITP